MSKDNIVAIIYTSRSDIRSAVRDEFRKIGLKGEQLITPLDKTECITRVNKSGNCILVLDWASGPSEILEILENNLQKGRIESHASLLIAPELTANIVAAAGEYQVSKIHTGEISVSQIKESLTAILKEVNNITPIKRLLVELQEFKGKSDFKAIDRLLAPIYPKLKSNPKIALEYAQNLIELQKYEEAELVLTEAIEIKPPVARVQNLMAKLYLKMGKKDKAVESFKTAQKVNPLNMSRLLDLGNLLLEMGNTGEAKVNFDQILKISPKSKDGALGKSSALLAEGNVNEALSLLKDTTSMKELASVFNTSAIVAIQSGDFDNAISLYKTAIEAVGKNKKVEARLWYNLGIGYVKWKKDDDGLLCFKKSSGLDPNFDDAKHNLASMTRRIEKSQKQRPKAGFLDLEDPLPMVKPIDNHADLVAQMEETIGAENLTGDMVSLNFDLDFDNDLLD